MIIGTIDTSQNDYWYHRYIRKRLFCHRCINLCLTFESKERVYLSGVPRVGFTLQPAPCLSSICAMADKRLKTL